MEQKSHTRLCACGCGNRCKGTWLPGHDQRLRAAIENEVGGLVELRRIIEELLHRSIDVKPAHNNRGHWQRHWASKPSHTSHIHRRSS